MPHYDFAARGTPVDFAAPQLFGPKKTPTSKKKRAWQPIPGGTRRLDAIIQ